MAQIKVLLCLLTPLRTHSHSQKCTWNALVQEYQVPTRDASRQLYFRGVYDLVRPHTSLGNLVQTRVCVGKRPKHRVQRAFVPVVRILFLGTEAGELLFFFCHWTGVHCYQGTIFDVFRGGGQDSASLTRSTHPMPTKANNLLVFGVLFPSPWVWRKPTCSGTGPISTFVCSFKSVFASGLGFPPFPEGKALNTMHWCLQVLRV